jgi:hypothetical protein
MGGWVGGLVSKWVGSWVGAGGWVGGLVGGWWEKKKRKKKKTWSFSVTSAGRMRGRKERECGLRGVNKRHGTSGCTCFSK